MKYEDKGLWKPLSGGGPTIHDAKNLRQRVASVFHMPSVGLEEVTLN